MTGKFFFLESLRNLYFHKINSTNYIVFPKKNWKHPLLLFPNDTEFCLIMLSRYIRLCPVEKILLTHTCCMDIIGITKQNTQSLKSYANYHLRYTGWWLNKLDQIASLTPLSEFFLSYLLEKQYLFFFFNLCMSFTPWSLL